MDTNSDRSEIEARVFRVVSETFRDSSVALTPDTMLQRDLSADSMQLIALMIALDAEFDAEFAIEQVPKQDVSLSWICAFVNATIQGAAVSQT